MANRLTFTKQRGQPSDYDRRRFTVETTANHLLTRYPALPAPRLIGYDRDTLTLRFERLAGSPIATGKFCPEIAPLTLTELAELAGDIAAALRPLGRETEAATLTRPAEWIGLPWSGVPDILARSLVDGTVPLSIAHGDLFPRNVMATCGRYVPIDWEWCGFYPAGWDLATLAVATVFHPAAVDALNAWRVSSPATDRLGITCALAVLCLRESVGRWTQPPERIAHTLHERGRVLADEAVRGVEERTVT